jgi:hypothetical protein
MPFDGADDKEIARAIINLEIDFDDAAFGKLNPEIIDLL